MMKRMLAVLSCLMLMIPCAAGEDKVYLAIGDSLSTGYGLLTRAGQKGFVELVGGHYGYRVVNRAVNGSRVPDVLELLQSGKIDADLRAADLITLTIGGNDLMGLLYLKLCDAYNASMQKKAQWIDVGEVSGILGNTSDTRHRVMLGCVQQVLAGDETHPSFLESAEIEAALESLRQGLGLIMTMLRSANPDATIVLTTQYHPYGAFADTPYALLSEGADRGIQMLNEVIRQNADPLGYVLADVYAAFAASDKNLCNASYQPLNLDVHPNAAGHALIAQYLIEVLDARAE